MKKETIKDTDGKQKERSEKKIWKNAKENNKTKNPHVKGYLEKLDRLEKRK